MTTTDAVALRLLSMVLIAAASTPDITTPATPVQVASVTEQVARRNGCMLRIQVLCVKSKANRQLIQEALAAAIQLYNC